MSRGDEPWRMWRIILRPEARPAGEAQGSSAEPTAGRRIVDEPESGGLDGGRTRARGGLAPTRLGGPEGDRLVGAEAAPPPSCLGHAGGARGGQKKLEQAGAGGGAEHPGKAIEVGATDEHRIGLKPILRRVWAPKGQRPIALGHHRYKWLYVTASGAPSSPWVACVPATWWWCRGPGA